MTTQINPSEPDKNRVRLCSGRGCEQYSYATAMYPGDITPYCQVTQYGEPGGRICYPWLWQLIEEHASLKAENERIMKALRNIFDVYRHPGSPIKIDWDEVRALVQEP